MPEPATEDVLDVVRVEIAGPIASFRYAHFLVGRQPTYPMPPPSTVYGLVSAAVGDFPDPASFRFAYRFACDAERADDVELIWFTKPKNTTRGKHKNHVQTASSNILPREWLVQPRMTLYLAGDDLDRFYEAFRVPRYQPVLGRSQDLVSFRSVDRLKLRRRSEGRFDESLLPISLRERLRYGSSINFPRFIEPRNRQQVDWDWFVALDQPVPVGPSKPFEPTADETFWADPDTADTNERERLLTFHCFVEGKAAEGDTSASEPAG